MKTTFKNSVLVAILAGLFALPVFGSDRIAYQAPVVREAAVLGRTTFDSMKNLKIVHQEDLLINLGDQENQTIYNILSRDYLSDKYKVFVVVANSYAEDGISIELEKHETNYNLLVTLLDSEFEFGQVPVSIIVISR